jgi:hypothetical protein
LCRGAKRGVERDAMKKKLIEVALPLEAIK